MRNTEFAHSSSVSRLALLPLQIAAAVTLTTFKSRAALQAENLAHQLAVLRPPSFRQAAQTDHVPREVGEFERATPYGRNGSERSQDTRSNPYDHPSSAQVHAQQQPNVGMPL
jgi:hypothetical protein